MRKRYNLLYILFAVTMIFSSSCTKNIVDEFQPIEEKWDSLDDFISSSSSQRTVNIPDASKEFVIETNTALMRFSAESILEENTDAIIQGPVSMVYTEISTYKDLFLNDIDTEDLQGETLYSRYILNFQLVQGNTVLKIDELKPVYIYLKEEDNDVDFERMFYWENVQNNDGWFLNSNIDVFTEEWEFELDGTEYKGSGFKILVRNTGMITLAEHEHLKHDSSLDYGNISISVEEIYKNSDTKMYIARKEDFALIPLDLVNGNYVHSLVRKEEEVIIFGMTVIDEKIYFGRKNIIVGETNDYSLSFREVSYVEAIEELQRM